MKRLIIAQFTFRQMRRGAILFALAVSFLVGAQGVALQATYPNDVDRKQAISALSGNPIIGMLYAETAHNDTPAGYMFYRGGETSLFIAGLWGLLFSTRMFRGQEDDQRTELLLSGSTTLSRFGIELFTGILAGIALAYSIIFVTIATVGRLDYINLSLAQSAYFALALVIPVAIFACIGALMSQFAESRRKAVMYGVIFLGGFTLLRSIGNTIPDLYWLKNFTPFGWIDRMSPVFNSEPIWILPTVISVIILSGATIWIMNRRDLGDSLIRTKDTTKPHFMLLRGPVGFGIRMSWGVLLGWLVSIVLIGFVIAGVTNTAVEVLQKSSSPLLQALFHNVGRDAIAKSFIANGSLFTSLLLMGVAAWGVGSMRSEEAKGFIDNFVVRRISRWHWMSSRLLIVIVSILLITLATNLGVWWVAHLQDIDLNLRTMIFDGINIVAPAVILTSIGVALYGIFPRMTMWFVYALFAWSFVSQILVTLIQDETARNIVMSTSLIQFITLVPIASPDWVQFWITMVLSLALILVGILGFSRRDLVSE